MQDQSCVLAGQNGVKSKKKKKNPTFNDVNSKHSKKKIISSRVLKIVMFRKFSAQLLDFLVVFCQPIVFAPFER